MHHSKPTVSIERHKAAIRRGEPSLPLKCLLRDGLIDRCESLFDFGCGHGEDIGYASEFGINASGWDPAFRPDAEKSRAEIVCLSYVLNVIEDVQERARTLRAAWGLTQRVLIVSARIIVSGIGDAEVEYGDGVVTRIGTFQKFYSQAELREYVESTLQVETQPAAPGVFYVFRDEDLRQHFLSIRYRRRSAAPRRRVSEIRFEKHRELLETLIEWVSDRGRLPESDELSNASAVIDAFGSIKRAFALIRRVVDCHQQWEVARRMQTEDLLVYLALTRFQRRPRFSALPEGLQRDMRAFFGSYTKACEQADELLYRAGDAEAIDAACQESDLGLLQENSLWLHRSAVEQLSPLLRVYEGCARAYIGETEDANIVKLHRYSGKVSYFACADFEREAHPSLQWCMKLSLRSREVYWYDSSESRDPLLLHAKDRLVDAGFPGHAKFEKLTAQEQKHGLVTHQCRFRRRSEWQADLATFGVDVRGHRLFQRRK